MYQITGVDGDDDYALENRFEVLSPESSRPNISLARKRMERDENVRKNIYQKTNPNGFSILFIFRSRNTSQKQMICI